MWKQSIEQILQYCTDQKQLIDQQKQSIEKHSQCKARQIQLIEFRKQLIEQKVNQFQETTPNSKIVKTMNVIFQDSSKTRK